MKVYLLEEYVEYEGNFFQSVHRTLEGAKKEAECLAQIRADGRDDHSLSWDSSDDVWTLELTLGAGCTYHDRWVISEDLIRD